MMNELDPSTPSAPESFAALVDVLRDRPFAVLAGAGCSTESGIPDYRGPDGSMRARKPVQYQDFVRSEASRIRYWARSAAGWPRIAAAQPNAGHRALAELEAIGAARGIITQNVDGLHQAAGSRRVVELHGGLAGVRCLACGERSARSAFQERLLKANPVWASSLAEGIPAAASAPDGDAELPESALAGFRVPGCRVCSGVIKPDVVFFGENVPPGTVEDAWGLFGESRALLVAGSSLTVYSGRRFVYRAREDRIPIVIINQGITRADEMAAARVPGRLGEVLPALVRALTESRR